MQLSLQFAVFLVSGMTLKAADYLGERKSVFAYVVATCTAFLFGLLVSVNSFNAALVFGIIIGVLLAKKVDRPNLVVGLILTLIFSLYFTPQVPKLELLLLIAGLAFLDEAGHDRFMRGHGIVKVFFRYRCALKLGVLLLTLLSVTQVINLVNLLGFDLAYEVMNYGVQQLTNKE